MLTNKRPNELTNQQAWPITIALNGGEQKRATTHSTIRCDFQYSLRYGRNSQLIFAETVHNRPSGEPEN